VLVVVEASLEIDDDECVPRGVVHAMSSLCQWRSCSRIVGVTSTSSTPEPIGDRVERSYESDLDGQASPASTSQPSTPCAENREQQQSETSRGRGRPLQKATVDQATL